MADSPKRLGAIVSTIGTSGSSLSGENVLIYTVPANTSAIVSTIFVCNRGATLTTFRIAHVDNGGIESLSNEDYLYYDIQIVGNDTFASTSGISMSTGDSLVAFSPSDNLTFIAEGIEIT
jgi:hypothetical protein